MAERVRESQEDSGRNTSADSGSMQAEHRIDQNEHLLPGMLDDITQNVIALKLPWKAFYILALVSRGWHRAIKSRRVYGARVCFKSTQTVARIKCLTRDGDYPFKLPLYTLEDKSFCNLPGIPNGDFKSGFPASCKWIPLDGKLYVLGGYSGSRGSQVPKLLSDVYVFDLAGQGLWKQRASMRDARTKFGCGIKDGKIYVFGGHGDSQILCASEVYDLEEDAWSPITPIPFSNLNPQVTTVGEEIFVHNEQSDFRLRLSACSAKVYHPKRDEWTLVENFIPCREDKQLLL